MERMPQAIISPSTTPRTRGAAIEQFQITVTSPKNTRKSISSSDEMVESSKTPKSIGRPRKVQTPSQSNVSSPNIIGVRTSNRNSQPAPNTPKTPNIRNEENQRLSRSNQGTPKAAEKNRKSMETLKPTTPKVTRRSISQESPTTTILRRSRSTASQQNTPKRGKNTEPEIEIVESLKTPNRKKQIENEKTPKTTGRVRKSIENPKSPETPKSNLRRSRSSASTQNTPKKGKNSETESIESPKLPVKGNDNLRNSLRSKETAQNTPKRVVKETVAAVIDSPTIVVAKPKENVRPSRSTTKTAAAVVETRSSRSTSDKRSSLNSGPSTPVRTTRRNLRQMKSAKK